MTRQGSAETLSSRMYAVIRDAILMGEVEPGSRLQTAALAEKYDSSTTVVREALTRLSTERIVRNIPQRGFFVQELSIDELDDLGRVRIHNDTFGLRLAVERGDLEWENLIITTHHRLSRVPRRDPQLPAVTRLEWTDAHRAFHLALLAACRIDIVQQVAAVVFDSTELYRRWAAPSFKPAHHDIDREHEQILQAALDRDVDRAAELLASHYGHSHAIMLKAGLALPERAAQSSHEA
ncbi:GntR family transcriptional regulator [Salinibacterium hongtaonis]|uniref:GntR family transcriptional regulator n=1 Tax=Homoserinimonas hongtaonis TaxID=2079791 RepID=UPI001304DE75|nr:GntR family transcriptional regulator [Salinibacterium hongtaonis]